MSVKTILQTLLILLLISGCQSTTNTPSPDSQPIPELGGDPGIYKNGVPLFQAKLSSESIRRGWVVITDTSNWDTAHRGIQMTAWHEGDREIHVIAKGLAPDLEDTGNNGRMISVVMERRMDTYVQLRSQDGKLRFVTILARR